MDKRNIRIILLLILVASVILSAACSADKPSTTVVTEEAERTDLIAAITSEPDTLDPHTSFLSVTALVNRHIFDSLLNVDANTNQISPSLAKEYSISEDGLTYTFLLREDVTYTSGRPFNAESVKNNVDHIRNMPYSYRIEEIKDVEIINDYEVSVILDHINGAFLKKFAGIAMVDVEAFNELGEDAFARNPVGSGPYMLENWSSGSEIVLKANPDYYLGEAPIKQLVFKIISDTTSMIIALENGEIDVAHEIAAIDFDDVKQNKDLTLYETPSAFVEYLYFNCEEDPWTDERVRKAVSLSIDKQAIIDVAFNGNATQADQPLTQVFPGYIQDLPPAERDVEKAKELLSDAGYPDGFSTTILSMAGFREQAAIAIQSNLNDIGVNAEIKLVEFGTLLDMGASGEFDLHIMELGVSYIESYDMLLYNFYTPFFGPSGNYGRGGNELTDTLLEESLLVGDEDERATYYTKIVEENLEKVFLIPLFNRTMTIAAKSELKGIEGDPLGLINYYKVSW